MKTDLKISVNFIVFSFTFISDFHFYNRHTISNIFDFIVKRLYLIKNQFTLLMNELESFQTI